MMTFVPDIDLTSVGDTVINCLNSKLHSQHPGRPDSVLSYGAVEKGDVNIFTLAGIVDAKVAPELHRLLGSYLSRKQNIIICMSDVLYLDSAGTATLLEAYVAARNQALGFMLADISQNARHTISLCRLNQVLPMCEHIEDAEQYIQRLRWSHKR